MKIINNLMYTHGIHFIKLTLLHITFRTKYTFIKLTQYIFCDGLLRGGGGSVLSPYKEKRKKKLGGNLEEGLHLLYLIRLLRNTF